MSLVNCYLMNTTDDKRQNQEEEEETTNKKLTISWCESEI